MEVGVGECTTLVGIARNLTAQKQFYGFDHSISRLHYGKSWLIKNEVNSNLFVSNMPNIPIFDSSIDLVYTSHSLETNRGSEAELIKEILRVARLGVILIEPIYELASSAAQDRMDKHSYVRNLKTISSEFEVSIEDYGLLPFSFNQLNPSGILVLRKKNITMLQIRIHYGSVLSQKSQCLQERIFIQ